MKTFSLFLFMAVAFAHLHAQQHSSPCKKRDAAFNFYPTNQKETRFNKSTLTKKYQLDSYFRASYDSGSWYFFEKEIYTYENDTTHKIENWDMGINEWDLDAESTCVMNSDGRINKIYDYDNDYKDYIYDSNNNLINIYHIWHEALSNDTAYIIEYIWDTIGNPVIKYIYGWDEDSNAFTMRQKDSIAYNKDGNKTSIIYFSYENNHFEKWGKNEYTYDTNGLQTSFLECEWYSNQWDSSYKRMYFYDSIGNPTEEYIYTYESKWMPQEKYVYNYNYAYTLSDILIPKHDPSIFWMRNKPVNMPTGYIGYEYLNNKWEISDTGIYNYSLKNTQHIHTPSVENIRVYPNPANDFITIEGVAENQGEIYIIDQYGRNKMSKQYTCGQKIPVSNLQTGVYFYQIITTDNTYSGTLIIQ